MTGSVRPVLLQPDNFTPPTRTPWGGTRLLDGIKAGLVARPLGSDARVGESWEVSVEPDFPSRTTEGESLDALIRADPHAWLGLAAARVASTELLVKLLDAEDDLSVQIHPDDDYPRLDPGQGGKPESWYVVEADPGACLYLGLAPGVDRAALEAALSSRTADVSLLMQRVAIAPGDFFVLEPGTPHAIGRGCLLVEPQRVTPGRKGITYRFWDWNRRYDSTGRPSETGTPRTLHVQHALAVTRFDAPRADDMLARIRRRGGPAPKDGPARNEPFCGPNGPIPSRNLEVSRLSGSGTLSIEPGTFRGLTLLEGQITVRSKDHRLDVAPGCSAALPATVAVELDLDHAHAILAAVP